MVLALPAQPHVAQKLKGDEAKAAKERLRDVKKAWKDATKADKYKLLAGLGRWPESSVSRFLLDTVQDDADDEVASWAALALTHHNDPGDHKSLGKLFSKVKTQERRAACIRWLGRYEQDAPIKLLEQVALGDDASAEAAVLAAGDARTEAGDAVLAAAATRGKGAAARVRATALLLSRGDDRGIEGLKSATTLEDASRAAHAAVGTELETDAIKEVLAHAGKAGRLTDRPHFFGSLLARLSHDDSHAEVAKMAGALARTYDVEIEGWHVSVNRAGEPFNGASPLLAEQDAKKQLDGLRMIQRQPRPYSGDELKAADQTLASKLDSASDEIAAHALFACVSTGAAADAATEAVGAWMKSERPIRRAAALLAAGPLGLSAHAPRAIELLRDEQWWVVSAALDCLLHLRPKECLKPVLELAVRLEDGRVFAEALALLRDLTGLDHGDLLNKWQEALAAEVPLVERKLETVRGVPYKRLRQRTAATFYGLELDSTNLQFAVDRSVSMILPVTREPQRPDFESRKADILKRRPEVNRMTRDGFMPRFHVAAAELNAALDAMSQKAQFGITLFNTQQFHSERGPNGIAERRKAFNWMLSTDPQGGTDIQAALLSIIEKAEADTIVLLSDGEPTSIAILEEIHRANAVKRLNIHVVSIHKYEYYRHYMHAMAAREFGRLIDAEPRD
jgi:hypothetical protein